MIKIKLAQKANSEIRDGETIFLDAGSTCLELAKLLVNRDVKIYTNSILIEALGMKNVTVINGAAVASIGAYASQEVVDFIAVQKFDKAFLGFASTHCGYNTSTTIEVKIKQAVMTSSKECFAIGDIAKKSEKKVFRYAKKGDLKLIAL